MCQLKPWWDIITELLTRLAQCIYMFAGFFFKLTLCLVWSLKSWPWDQKWHAPLTEPARHPCQMFKVWHYIRLVRLGKQALKHFGESLPLFSEDVIPFHGKYSGETPIGLETQMRMYVASLFVISKNQEQPKCSSREEHENKELKPYNQSMNEDLHVIFEVHKIIFSKRSQERMHIVWFHLRKD